MYNLIYKKIIIIKLMINTLILSGGSSKGIAYIGIFQSLFYNNIINIDNIKYIISCSAGSIFSLILCLNYNLNIIKKIFINFNHANLFDLNNLDDLFSNNGLFDINKLKLFIQLLLYHKFNTYNISLIDLYKKTNIKLIIKVYNYSKKKNQYISYINHPNMNIIDLICMSCSIPFIFKYYQYNNQIYIDGGITGNLPILKNKKYKKYLAINLNESTIHNKLNILSYIQNIFNIRFSNKSKQNNRILNYDINLDFYNFDISILDKLNIIHNSYNITNKYIKSKNLNKL